MKIIIIIGNDVFEVVEALRNHEIKRLLETNITARRDLTVDLEYDQRQFDKLVKAITLREKPIQPHIPQIGIGRRRGKGERKKNRADRWR